MQYLLSLKYGVVKVFKSNAMLAKEELQTLINNFPNLLYYTNINPGSHEFAELCRYFSIQVDLEFAEWDDIKYVLLDFQQILERLLKLL